MFAALMKPPGCTTVPVVSVYAELVNTPLLLNYLDAVCGNTVTLLDLAQIIPASSALPLIYRLLRGKEPLKLNWVTLENSDVMLIVANQSVVTDKRCNSKRRKQPVIVTNLSRQTHPPCGKG
jgi:hypothetical protein